MKLPNASNARIEKEEIIEYLLNARHPYGSSKSSFFTRFGFTVEQWESFAARLRRQGSSHPVSRVTETVFGPRYNVDGEIVTPDGRNPNIRTVWQMDHWRACSAPDYGISYRAISMIKEHDCVVLATDLPTEGLAAGDIGTVVHVHKGGEGYEIEFMTLDGQTVAVSTLLANQVRPIARGEIAHARSLVAA